MHIPIESNHWLWSPWLPVLAFLLLVGPFSLDFHLHYPDEMYYTDAAIRMMQNGDFLTTYLGDGALRFKKPILTYWFVLAGFQAFGVSAFASRVLFLLAGAGLVGLTYLMGRMVSEKKLLPVFAAWIVASHPLVIFSSSRSIPDILLVFFMTLSALGMMACLKYGNSTPKRYLWILYLGLGLAFEVKGLPAAALGVIGLGYMLFNPWKPIHWKKLFYWPAIFSGIFIALFWFVAMYLKFGPFFLDSFMEDQVGMRIGDRFLLIARHFIFAVLLMGLMFFPWVFLTLRKFKSRVKASIRDNRPFFGFLFTWMIAIILMTAMVSTFYERYLLPVIPVVAIGLAWLIPMEKTKSLTNWSWIFILLNGLVLIVAFVLNLVLSSSIYVFLQWTIGLIILIFLVIGIKTKRPRFPILGMAFIFLFYNLSLLSYPISIPHQGVQIKALIEEKKLPQGTEIAFVGHPHYSSKIRIGLGENYFMKDAKLDMESEIPGDYDYFICDEPKKILFDEKDYDIELASLNWDPKYISEMLEAISVGGLTEGKLRYGKKFYWVEKRQ
jgi:4-amino-4-deoxy-L-arabinose transferase-like glycosyltransferase